MNVLLVTDPRWSDERIVEVTRAAGGALGAAFAVQVRDRAAPPASLARSLRDVTRASGARLYVNRWIDLARAIDADGLHGAAWERAFTMPAHDDTELSSAIALGAEAVLVSPIFETPGKGPAKGVGAIAHARQLAPRHVRIVALGGITAENAAACRASGADAVAVMRALLDADDPAAAALLLAGRLAG